MGPWLTPALLPHSSPAKEVASPASLVNGVQPSKHENGFSGTEGSQELLELSHHGTSPGSIIPFGDKEPFLKQAVVKPPQVTGERWGGCTGGQGDAMSAPVSPPHPPSACRGAVRARPRKMSPQGHRTRPDSGRPRRTVAVVRRKTSLLPPARRARPALPRRARALWDPGEAAADLLPTAGTPGFSLCSCFYFVLFFVFFKYAPYQTDTPTLAACQSRPRRVV